MGGLFWNTGNLHPPTHLSCYEYYHWKRYKLKCSWFDVSGNSEKRKNYCWGIFIGIIEIKKSLFLSRILLRIFLLQWVLLFLIFVHITEFPTDQNYSMMKQTSQSSYKLLNDKSSTRKVAGKFMVLQIAFIIHVFHISIISFISKIKIKMNFKKIILIWAAVEELSMKTEIFYFSIYQYFEFDFHFLCSKLIL